MKHLTWRRLLWFIALPLFSIVVGCAPNATTAQKSAFVSKNLTTSSAGKTTLHLAKAKKAQTKPKPIPILQFGNSGPQVEYLNEALAMLNELPISFTPSSSNPHAPQNIQKLVGTHKNPIHGSFRWKYKSLIPLYQSAWNPMQFNILTKGALMSFESQHGITIDGIAGPQVWGALKTALRTDDIYTGPYINVTVAKTNPEKLYVWKNGTVIYSSLANTGIAQSPTQDGTWPVYLRYRSQTMQGTTPWGSTYSDPGVPWINYFHGGDAIHGFIRSSYGFPQSLGCVELPIANADQVYHMIHYGTLVTVQS